MATPTSCVYPQLRFIHIHQLFRNKGTCFALDTVTIDRWICLYVRLVIVNMWCVSCEYVNCTTYLQVESLGSIRFAIWIIRLNHICKLNDWHVTYVCVYIYIYTHYVCMCSYSVGRARLASSWLTTVQKSEGENLNGLRDWLAYPMLYNLLYECCITCSVV